MAGPPVGALEIVNADQLCVNLTHNMKVYININRSIWFKTDDDELSIAVTNAVGLAKKPMFSLNARHLKVSSDDTGCVRGQVMMIANYTSS